MKIIRLSDGGTVAKAPPCVCALGSFDGVHTGHAALLSNALSRAAESGGKLASAVWMLRGKPDTAALLSDEREKCARFAASGIEYVFIEDFDDVKSLSPEEFVRDTLVGTIGCRVAVCGFNFRFGCRASGDAALLGSLMRQFGGDAHAVEPVIYDGAPVSSTRIREALAAGDVSAASEMLGAPYALRGTVERGKMLGRTLGFPTANIFPHRGRATPKRGVYLTRCAFDGQTYSAVTNIGHNPTVSDEERIVCESHLLDFSEDIYGKEIEVRFFAHLRDERRFEGVDELALAVKENIAQCREWDRRIKENGESIL